MNALFEAIKQYEQSASALNPFIYCFKIKEITLDEDKFTAEEFSQLLAWFLDGGKLKKTESDYKIGKDKYRGIHYTLVKGLAQLHVGFIRNQIGKSKARGMDYVIKMVADGICRECDNKKAEEKKAAGFTLFKADGSLLKWALENFQCLE